MTREVKIVDSGLRHAYSNNVPEKKGSWGESQNKKADSRHQAVFFRPYYLCVPSMAGLGGGVFGHAGYLLAGLSTPPCVRHPRLRARSGSSIAQGGGPHA